MDQERFATPDRRKAYRDPIKSGETLCTVVVLGTLFVASVWFWAGLTA